MGGLGRKIIRKGGDAITCDGRNPRNEKWKGVLVGGKGENPRNRERKGGEACKSSRGVDGNAFWGTARKNDCTEGAVPYDQSLSDERKTPSK